MKKRDIMEMNKQWRNWRLDERYIDPDDAGKTINYALDDLQQSLKRVRNPERWAEKYHKNLPVIIDMMEKLTKVFGKMK